MLVYAVCVALPLAFGRAGLRDSALGSPGARFYTAEAGLSELRLEQCPLLNVSVCNATESLPAAGEGAVVVVIYNPLAWPRKEVVRVPVQTIHVEVLHDSCEPAVSQVQNLLSPREELRLDRTSWGKGCGWCWYGWTACGWTECLFANLPDG